MAKKPRKMNPLLYNPRKMMNCYLTVAYTSDEVLYVWTDPKSAVSYEGRLELSQFDIRRTEFRGLNYSRATNYGGAAGPGYSVLQVRTYKLILTLLLLK